MRTRHLVFSTLALPLITANAGCTFSDADIAYVVSTERGDVVVTCEYFRHDMGYWEPTDAETQNFQWVCDEIPDQGSFGRPPQTVVNPYNTAEVARRR